MNDNAYDIGYVLGQQWAVRDATAEQLDSVSRLGDGNTWVESQAQPADALTELIDPRRQAFMAVDDVPSATFVGGFIDGARAVESAN